MTLERRPSAPRRRQRRARARARECLASNSPRARRARSTASFDRINDRFVAKISSHHMSSVFERVTLRTRANVYFDGKCVSHAFTTANGEEKSAGVILGPNTELGFSTSKAEVMTCVGGSCEYRLRADEEGRARAWITRVEGESFAIEENSSFEIRVKDAYHYVCSYA